MPTNLPTRLMPFRYAALRFVSVNTVRCAVVFAVMRVGCPGVSPGPAPLAVPATPAIWLTDTTPSAAKTYPVGAMVPGKPLEGQETRPDRCMFRAATYINGGCWVALAVTPPCVPGSFQHGNACYAPQTKSPDVPVSVGR